MHLLSYAQMETLARVYFEKIDPCYGFLNSDSVFEQISTRWASSPLTPHPADALLAGIAALGSYFSKAHAVSFEGQLVVLAKAILDAATLSNTPDADNITAWVCHVTYLRLTASPPTAWIASCTMMHIFEAAGVHRDAHRETLVMPPLMSMQSQSLKRAFGIAQHLNMWIAYDIGLSRINLQAPRVLAPLAKAGSYSDRLLQLLPSSLELDRLSEEDEPTLRMTLATISAKSDIEPPLVMAQCNLLLCILRQLCARNALRTHDDSSLDQALRFLQKGLRAARQMIEDDTPWHHLANIPFQTLCTLLTIDTPTSLAIVGEAMQTLQDVKNAYNTATLNDACNTAYLILFLHRKRRWDDAQAIDNILSGIGNVGGMTPGLENGDVDPASPNNVEVSWFNDLVNGFPSLQEFSFADFINTGAIS